MTVSCCSLRLIWSEGKFKRKMDFVTKEGVDAMICVIKKRKVKKYLVQKID